MTPLPAGWMVARVRPNLTVRAITNMERQGYECYAPRAMIRTARAHRLREQPLFPGYVFARHRAGRWLSLQGTFGVLGLVMAAADHPAVLPDSEIARIHAREGLDGLVRLEARDFHVGERVHVSTKMVEIDAIVDGMSGRDRVFVLMQMLGRFTRVEVDVKDLSSDE